MTSELTDINRIHETTAKSPSDSSLLIKVTVRDSTILAGRPTTANVSDTSSVPRRFTRRRKPVAFAVVQVLSNALVMFQSIENHDASGSKTLHVSLDNLSASVDTDFEHIPNSQVALIDAGTSFVVLLSSTDNEGRYCIEGIPVGSYRVVFGASSSGTDFVQQNQGDDPLRDSDVNVNFGATDMN